MKFYRHIFTVTWIIFMVCCRGLFAGENMSTNFIVDTFSYVADSDSDGMPDEWELANGLDPLVDDSAANPDGDSRTNIEEYNAGTDPQVADLLDVSEDSYGEFILDMINKQLDSDDDGMPDEWELANGLDPFVDDSGANPDGDSRTNIEEYNAGTDPQVADIYTYSISESETNIVDTGAYPLGFDADSDGDGMPDWWEGKYGLNLLVDDSGDDPDGDGYTNIQEYLLGMSPIVDDVFGMGWGISVDFIADTILLLLDSDGDGMPDWWEVLNGLDPFADDSGANPDGDSRTNIEEYNADTDPHVDDWRGPSDAASLYFLTDTGAYPLGFDADSDGDGMPDWWEIEHSLDPGIDDSFENPDGDALTNLEEYNAGTDPYVFDFMVFDYGEGNLFTVNTLSRFADSDGDGIPDWWEIQYFGDPVGMLPDGDDDGDGVSNYDEFIAGSNPSDSLSVFAIDDIASTGSDVMVLTWSTISGRIYSVYSHTDLSTPWPTSPIYQVEGDGSVKSYTNIVSTGELRFFRLGVEMQ